MEKKPIIRLTQLLRIILFKNIYWIEFHETYHLEKFSGAVLVYCILFCRSLPNFTASDLLKEFVLNNPNFNGHVKK